MGTPASSVSNLPVTSPSRGARAALLLSIAVLLGGCGPEPAPEPSPTVVLVTLGNLRADLVGRDRATDLAVLRIRGKAGETFEALELLEDRVPRVGETVLALGNPMGLGHSVTSGIAVSR